MKNGKNGTNGKSKKIAYIDGVEHQIEPHHSTILKFLIKKKSQLCAMIQT